MGVRNEVIRLLEDMLLLDENVVQCLGVGNI